MKYNRRYRSAMNIKYSPEIVNICCRVGFKADSFDREDEPADMKDREGFTLSWGVETVLKRNDVIPDIIYDKGDIGNEPIVRVLGRNPKEVVDKIIKIVQLMVKK